jgi:hypothetical protein
MKSRERQLAETLDIYSRANSLKKQDLATIECLRKSCAIYLANSEKYIRVRIEQSAKSMINRGKKQ